MRFFFPCIFQNGLDLKTLLKVQKSKTVLFTMSQAPGRVKSPCGGRFGAVRPGWAAVADGAAVRFNRHAVLLQFATGVSS
jgi:hypothetical protein